MANSTSHRRISWRLILWLVAITLLIAGATTKCRLNIGRRLAQVAEQKGFPTQLFARTGQGLVGKSQEETRRTFDQVFRGDLIWAEPIGRSSGPVHWTSRLYSANGDIMIVDGRFYGCTSPRTGATRPRPTPAFLLSEEIWTRLPPFASFALPAAMLASVVLHLMRQRQSSRVAAEISLLLYFVLMVGVLFDYNNGQPYRFDFAVVFWQTWLFIACAGLVFVSRPKLRQSDRPLCGICNYDLTGNLSGVCPECGTPIELSLPDDPALKGSA